MATKKSTKQSQDFKNQSANQNKTFKKAFPNTFVPKDGKSVQDIITQQLGGKQYVKLNKLGSIYLIPGENPNYGMLFGSNIFAVGLGKKRYLIDACQLDQEKFLSNVEAFVTDHDCYFEGILITHAHYDHMGGAYDIIKLMKKLGKPVPTIYKFVNENESELERREENKEVKEYLEHINEDNTFEMTETLGKHKNGKECKIVIKPVETPGHLSDHLCFLYSEQIGAQKTPTYHIFTGDSILGGKSTFFENYVDYFNSLKKTQKLVNDLNIKKLFVAHSQTLYPKDIVFDAPQKVKAYVDRRVRKDKQLEDIAEHLAKKLGAFTIQDVYQAQMKFKVKKNPKKQGKIEPKLGEYFTRMLDRQVQKQVADGKLNITEEGEKKIYTKVQSIQAKL